MAERTAAPQRPAGGALAEREPGAAIELIGLRRDFGERIALAGVDLRLERGQTLAVLGPNGSGKTTLLRILAGLLRPSGGQALVLGADLPGETWRLRGRVGYLGHEPMLYRDLTAEENLLLAARLNRIERDDARGRIDSLLDSMRMRDRAGDRVAELSAGMSRRISICQAVLHEPELLLLDEPESHLDRAARELAEDLIGAAGGRTRVVVSHDRERALAGADLVLEL